MSSETNTKGVSRISRRVVVAGAAWSVPAITMASPAAAVVTSHGPLSFTGKACKLPGHSSDTFKGYVFELVSDNPGGPPGDTIIQVRNVTVDSIATGFAIVMKTTANQCNCAPCGTSTHEICVKDDTLGARSLIYTAAEPTGNSLNAEMTLQYRLLDCSCNEVQTWTNLSSGLRATPPATKGGGSCQIPDVFPLP